MIWPVWRRKRPLFVIICLIIVVYWMKLVHLRSKLFKMTAMASVDRSATVYCTFGVISDVQYADIPDGTNFAKTTKRYYRGALEHLKHAVQQWKATEVDFAMDLGDIIDGFGARHEQSERILDTVLNEYDKLNKPVFFHWGNHDYYNFNRKDLLANERYNSISRNQLSVTGVSERGIYYHYSPCPGFRIIALDLYEISMLGVPKTSSNYARAAEILSINPNEDPNSSLNMPKEIARFVKFNGAASDEQLQWLDQLLETADNNKERVLVSGHMPIYEPATDAHCLAWNYDKILYILHKHPSVVAYFSGHDHKGGRAMDSAGVQHVTFPGVVETKAGEEAFAIVRVTAAGMEVQGYGRVESLTIPFGRDF